MKRKFLGFTVFIIVAAILLAGCGQEKAAPGGKAETGPGTKPDSKQEFTIGIIPQQSQGAVKTAMDKLQEVLQKNLNRPVKITVYPDYNGVVEAMNYHKVDMAYFGPLTFVVANQKSGAQAIIAELINGDPHYQSYIITRKDSGIASLDDLKQKAAQSTFAFGDPESTSGALFPSIELKELGLFTDKNNHKFKQVVYTGSHDATALAIKQGNAQVGGIDSVVFGILDKKGTIHADDFRILWQSKKLFEYPWAVQKDTDPALIKQIQDAFISIKDPEILDAFGASGFTTAKTSDFDDIKQAAESMGRLGK